MLFYFQYLTPCKRKREEKKRKICHMFDRHTDGQSVKTTIHELAIRGFLDPAVQHERNAAVVNGTSRKTLDRCVVWMISLETYGVSWVRSSSDQKKALIRVLIRKTHGEDIPRGVLSSSLGGYRIDRT